MRRLRLRLVPLPLEQGMLEGEVDVLGEGGVRVGPDLLRGRGVGVEQIDRGHRQELGRRQIRVLRLVDAKVGAVRLAERRGGRSPVVGIDKMMGY